MVLYNGLMITLLDYVSSALSFPCFLSEKLTSIEEAFDLIHAENEDWLRID